MTGLREYITTRQAALRDEMLPLAARRDELRNELDGVAAKLKKLEREWNELARAANAIGVATQQVDEDQAPERSMTIKKAVLTVLARNPNGMTAAEILRAINLQFFNGRIERTSLSPQLTRLRKDDNKVSLRGNKWVLHDPESPGAPL